MHLVVIDDGKYGFPLGGRDNSQTLVEFRGKRPRPGAVVSAITTNLTKKSALPVVSEWKYSQDWVRFTEVDLASGEADPSQPVPRLLDPLTLDRKALLRLRPVLQLVHGEFFVRASHVSELVSHYEFQGIDAERAWVAACVREGRSPAQHQGKPLRYRSEVARPLIEAFGEEHFVKAARDEVESVRAEQRALAEKREIALRQIKSLQETIEKAKVDLDRVKQESNGWVARLERLQQEGAEMEKRNAQLEEQAGQRKQRLQELEARIREMEEEEGRGRVRLRAKNRELENQHKLLLEKVEEAKRRARLEHDQLDTRVPALRELSELVDERSTLERLAERLDDRIGFEDLVGLHVAMKLFPFVVLTGPSGSGKSSLLRHYGDSLGFFIEMIPVQPNWSSVADLHGYVFPLGAERHFVSTPFSRALGMQVEEEEFLSLVILDEINLAHVEYYLADYLSAFERDRIVDIASPIELQEAKAPEWLKAFQGRIRVPETFLMAGTANEDHTTRAFSDKFRDRMAALEIVPDELKFGELNVLEPEPPVEPIGRVTPATWMGWRAAPRQEGPKKTTKAFKAANDILSALRGAGLEFGRRQFRDVLHFVVAAEPLLAVKGGKAEDRAMRACDIALEMRLLQKSAPLLEPLQERHARMYLEAIEGIEKAVRSQKKNFPRVARWVEEMKARD